MGLKEAPNHKPMLSARMQKWYKYVDFTLCFEGQITKYCKLQTEMMGASRPRSVAATMAPYTTLLEPLHMNPTVQTPFALPLRFMQHAAGLGLGSRLGPTWVGVEQNG